MTKLEGWTLSGALLLLSVATVLPCQAQNFTTLAIFEGGNGYEPDAPLVQGIDGNMYGTTRFGGYRYKQTRQAYGVVFKISPAGNLGTAHAFCVQQNNGVCTDGNSPYGVLQPAGNFYIGTTYLGGDYDGGTVFKLAPGNILTTLHSFSGRGTDGLNPLAGVVQATNGAFYGTTLDGGSGGGGTIFKINAQGSFTTLYTFPCNGSDCPDGYLPLATLIQATDGNLYGTTSAGGSSSVCYFQQGCGTVFKITLLGQFTRLYSFCHELSDQGACADGASPEAALIQGADGNFYGTTGAGGTQSCFSSSSGCGTIFRITPQGTLTTLYSFCAQKTGQGECADGEGPTGLIQATDGNFYGTAFSGGTGDEAAGVIFQFTPAGALTVLYSFNCSQGDCGDGGGPNGLLQATDGSFYGAAEGGGDLTCGNGGCGTVFRLSMGLGPFISTLPAAANIGAEVGILGTDLTGTTGVTFNSIPATFSAKLPTLILTHVPAGATTGFVTVTTPSGTLTSNVPFHVIR
jgi:uncharacterized repeat protein (TIGR03803 family)